MCSLVSPRSAFMRAVNRRLHCLDVWTSLMSQITARSDAPQKTKPQPQLMRRLGLIG